MKFARIHEINGTIWADDVAGRLIDSKLENKLYLNKRLNEKIAKKFNNIDTVRISRYKML